MNSLLHRRVGDQTGVSNARYVRVAQSVPDDLRLPSVDDLHARTRALQAENDPLVQVRRLGVSGDGEPIDLISIGQSRRSALVVGTPHPNEPIGCLTIEYLIERLRRDQALREELDFTWHFIKTIEPDGLRLNQGWLSRPFNAEVYLRNFYRPAARQQAEYCFPIDIDGYRFDTSTPENLAWQEAVRLTSPQLLYSLHNCEYGGAFYVLSQQHPELAATLARQPELFDMPVDAFGEAIEAEASQSVGVFSAFDPESVLRAERAAGKTGPLAYDAGQSSFGFCKPIGTLGLIAETPHWRHSTERLLENVEVSIAVAQQDIRRLGREVTQLLRRYLPPLEAQPWRYSARFRASLIEMGAHAELRSRVILPWNASMQDVVIQRKRHSILFNLLRPVGMLSRLAAGVLSVESGHQGAAAARAASEDLLVGALQRYRLVECMEAVSLKQSVGIQVLAGLQTAAMLR